MLMPDQSTDNMLQGRFPIHILSPASYPIPCVTWPLCAKVEAPGATIPLHTSRQMPQNDRRIASRSAFLAIIANCSTS